MSKNRIVFFRAAHFFKTEYIESKHTLDSCTVVSSNFTKLSRTCSSIATSSSVLQYFKVYPFNKPVFCGWWWWWGKIRFRMLSSKFALNELAWKGHNISLILCRYPVSDTRGLLLHALGENWKRIWVQGVMKAFWMGCFLANHCIVVCCWVFETKTALGQGSSDGSKKGTIH